MEQERQERLVLNSHHLPRLGQDNSGKDLRLMIISFMGNDGSGKSTYCNMLSNSLSASYPVRYVSEFTGPLLNLLKRFKKVSSYDNASREISFSTRLSPYIVWLDCLLQIVYYKITYKSRMVIKDRCAYDYLATWVELGVSNRI